MKKLLQLCHDYKTLEKERIVEYNFLQFISLFMIHFNNNRSFFQNINFDIESNLYAKI